MAIIRKPDKSRSEAVSRGYSRAVLASSSRLARCWTVDGASTICRANDAAVKLFGAPLEGSSALLSTIWAAENGRTAPSAGALYPLELYLLTSDGIFHYEPSSHRLTVLARDDRHRALFDAALQQSAVRDAPAVIIVTADYARTEVKYGEDRTPRYVQLEAGHAAQNVLLQAVALGLGAAPIGAFEDDKVQSALGIPTSHRPLYLIPVGHPK